MEALQVITLEGNTGFPLVMRPKHGSFGPLPPSLSDAPKVPARVTGTDDMQIRKRAQKLLTGD